MRARDVKIKYRKIAASVFPSFTSCLSNVAANKNQFDLEMTIERGVCYKKKKKIAKNVQPLYALLY